MKGFKDSKCTDSLTFYVSTAWIILANWTLEKIFGVPKPDKFKLRVIWDIWYFDADNDVFKHLKHK